MTVDGRRPQADVLKITRMKPTYDPSAVEAAWYPRWEEAGLFRPEDNPDGEPFSIVIPPPNVTGVLHIGHALNHPIQDVIIRRKRMQGFQALWLPGTDHAGIATQNVVERELAAEGLTRHDLGREAFVEQVWAWKRKSGGDRSPSQMRRLGCSCDWSRERFTLDDGLSAAVREVFVRLYEKGLIYRGNRIVNWCPRCQTALSDLEVEYEDELPASSSTSATRSRTAPGTSDRRHHPARDDARRHRRGGPPRRRALRRRRRQDGHAAARWTARSRSSPTTSSTPSSAPARSRSRPAHDPNDFEIGERHGPRGHQRSSTIEAKITESGGAFAGLDRFEARTAVKEALAERAAARPHRGPEPLGRPLLALRDRGRAAPVAAVVRQGRPARRPRPSTRCATGADPLRPAALGEDLLPLDGEHPRLVHQPPALVGPSDPGLVLRRLRRGRRRQGGPDRLSAVCGERDLRQDEDVLDTWFSSALWPFSTLGWPDETPDLRHLLPDRRSRHRLRHHLLLGRPDDA